MKKMQIKILKPFGAYKINEVVLVDVDSAGTPISQYWRLRLKDMPIDNCCEELKTLAPVELPLKAKKSIKKVGVKK